jgi:hypothetical protein
VKTVTDKTNIGWVPTYGNRDRGGKREVKDGQGRGRELCIDDLEKPSILVWLCTLLYRSMYFTYSDSDSDSTL